MWTDLRQRNMYLPPAILVPTSERRHLGVVEVRLGFDVIARQFGVWD